ncbi:MAG: SusE domain-containing protein [Prevotellaceae bacterium]|nr:SusE domain-containing protein [Prevotellaceae bacterium]
MKKIVCLSMIVMFAVAMTACTENMNYKDAEVRPPAGMLFPTDGYFLELQSGSGATMNFSWLPGASEDGYPVQYEIVFFDRSSGGRELGRVDAGVKTQIAVAHKDLNRIAGEAAIESGSTGTLYWSVVASRGLNQLLSTATPRKLDIKRLLGFNFIPERLYLIGTGTEAGNDAALALPFRTTGEGEYEIYTRFSNGTFMIVDDPVAPTHSYGFQGGLATEITTPVTVPGQGIYRVQLDFNVKSASVQLVSAVGHWLCYKSELTPMTYEGRGLWVLRDYYLDANDYWVAVPAGSQDDRYHFRATIAGNPWPWECFGPTNSGEDGKPASLDAKEYFYIKAYPSTSADQWGPKFKYHGSVCEKTVDIYLDMGATNATHWFVVK